MNKLPHTSIFTTTRSLLLLVLLLIASGGSAATAFWTGASGTDTNWSDAGNWTGGTGTGGVAGPLDDVVFGNAGASLSISGISNVVDSTTGNFGGTIGSLQFTNSIANSFQNTLIAPGVTLNITNNSGPFSSALFVGTPTAAGANSIFASISGPGATVNVNNTNAVISLTQAGSASTLATLIMTNLGTFNANISKLAIGDYFFGIGSVAAQGALFLARTNTITTSWVGNYSNPYSVTITNAIQLGEGSSATLGGINALYLGLTNAIFTDSIGVGGIKGGGSASATHLVAFAPFFTNSSPTAYFRGINGTTSRVSFWGVGDTATSGSSSAPTFGKVDLSFGLVDAWVDTMILARDRNTTAAAEGGVFTFTAGKVNINTLIAGDQASATGGAACSGAMNVSGATAVLTVNNVLELGITTLTGGPASALSTRGVLSVTNGTVLANNIIVGAASITNNINLINGTLMVTNSLATNAAGLFVLNISNSTIGLTVSGSGSLFGLAQTLNTAGATNLVQLINPAPVIFASYPRQFPLIKYSTWTGSNSLSLAGIPVWAPGATLVSNGPNNSLDLSLPIDPRPVFTGTPPSPYSGSPGDNVTTNFSVSISAGSVMPLGYQWYYVSGGVTNLLANGPGPSGLSTLSGSTTTNLQIANAQPGDNGNYFVVATNLFGTNSSSQALLTISAGAIAPVVNGPASQTATNGITTAIVNTASGSPVPALYWQFNGANLGDGPGPSGSSTISGSSTATLTISNPQYPGDQGTYSLIASNSAGLATNSTVLTVIVPPVITNQPVSLVVTNTQVASFTVVAGGVPAPTYQWNKNGAPISPTVNNTATNATFTIASVSPGDTSTNYSVTISNPAGTTNTVTVSLIVNSTMAATALAPANGTTGVCYDTPLYVTFNATPVLRNAGNIKIYNVTNSTTPMDTINLGLNSGNGTQARSPFPGDSQGFNYYPVVINGSMAAIYPHSGVMTSNQTYYVTIDDGVFTDTSGAYFGGISATNAWQFATKIGGPANATNLVVAADGSGDFVTVQGAVDSIPLNNTRYTLINIHNGIYFEIVDISSKPGVTFRGQNRNGTAVGYPNNASIAPGGTTHARMAFKVNSRNIAIENMTVTNMTPQGGSQAEALMIESGASQFILNNAEVDSRQDTILANVNSSQGYFYNSLVTGNFDYIWGGGNLFFTNCEIRTISGTGTPNLAAPRTDNGTTGNWPGYSSLLVSNGFSFVDCQLTRQSGVVNCSMSDANGSPNGLAAFINCNFDTACYTNALSTAYTTQLLWDYGCSNLDNSAALNSPGSPFLGFTQLNNGDPRLLAAQSSTNWLNGWLPQLAPNILTNPASQSVSGGGTATFTVAATGIADPVYQWLKNGNPISGQTGASLTIGSASANDAASYSVIVSNNAGVVTSTSASLTVGNTPPTLAPVSNQTVNVGVSVNITNVATDPDVPAQTLNFSQLAGPGSVNPVSGVYMWRPPVASAGTSNNIIVVVTDNGVPNLSATNAFAVIVNPVAEPTTSSATYSNGQFSLTVNGTTGPDYILQGSTNLFNWQSLLTNSSPTPPFTFTDTNAGAVPLQFYRILLGP